MNNFIASTPAPELGRSGGGEAGALLDRAVWSTFFPGQKSITIQNRRTPRINYYYFTNALKVELPVFPKYIHFGDARVKWPNFKFHP